MEIGKYTFETKNNVPGKYHIDRKSFVCAKIKIPTDGFFIKDVANIANRIEPNLNFGQANTSLKRKEEIVEIDNLLGLIAEHVCYRFLIAIFGEDKFEKSDDNSAMNQVDITLSKSKKKIEVRSSCVKNGLDFALFAKNHNSGIQYFDVIGPYITGYKPGEELKDYYMRVIYECEKIKFKELLKAPTLTLYITGGATKEMMEDSNFYIKKHLIPAFSDVNFESDYRVIPIGKSLDITDFLNAIEKDI